MKDHKILWLIVGIVLVAVGIFLMDVSVVLGIILFITGLSVLILLSISWMRISGGVKDNYFYQGNVLPSERFSPSNAANEESVNIWDQISGQEGNAE